MAGVFENIDNFLDNNLNEITTIVSNAISSDITAILSTSILLYVIFYGYMVLAGKIQAPVEDLIWNLARFAVLITFINNGDNWLNLTKEAIKALSTIGGGSNGLAFIDDQFARVAKLANDVANNAKWGSGWAVSIIIWAGFILSCFPAAIIIIVNKITMYFLLALLPLFIFCLMWGWLKESFNQYMSAILSNALVIVVMTAMLKAIVIFFESFNPSEGNAYLVSASYFLTGLFGAALVKFLAAQCLSLMRVSLDKIPSMKSYQKAEYQGEPGSESKKGKLTRYSKNAIGSLYNQSKL